MCVEVYVIQMGYGGYRAIIRDEAGREVASHASMARCYGAAEADRCYAEIKAYLAERGLK